MIAEKPIKQPFSVRRVLSKDGSQQMIQKQRILKEFEVFGIYNYNKQIHQKF
jgi:hypothetical protein